MNTNKLAKLYPTLSAVERLRMLHAAGLRGDAVERQRLIDAAPRQYFSRADTGELEIRLSLFAVTHHAGQMALAAEFWHAQTRVAWMGAFEQVDEADEPTCDTYRFWGYCVIVLERAYVNERDGWNLFIQRNGFDHARITSGSLADHWILDYMDEQAKPHPDSLVRDAMNWFREREDLQPLGPVEPLTLITPESVADGWHRAVEARGAA